MDLSASGFIEYALPKYDKDRDMYALFLDNWAKFCAFWKASIA